MYPRPQKHPANELCIPEESFLIDNLDGRVSLGDYVDILKEKKLDLSQGIGEEYFPNAENFFKPAQWDLRLLNQHPGPFTKTLQENGFEPATLHHALMFGVQHRQKINLFRILFLGSNYMNPINNRIVIGTNKFSEHNVDRHVITTFCDIALLGELFVQYAVVKKIQNLP